MKTAFLKFLPIAAAVLLATSCSKDDNDNAPATQSGSDGVETVTANTIPFSIRVNTGHSLKKVGYAESTNEDEKGWYNITFSDEDVDKLKMKIYIGEITNESNLFTTLTLKNATTGEFTGTVGSPAFDADLTAVITTDGNSLVTSSDKSLQDLLATCAHKFLGTFKYGAAEVTLTDQTSYLAITLPSDETTVNVNGKECALKDGKVWVAFNSSEKVHSARLSLFNKQAEPGTIYTVTREKSTFVEAEFTVAKDDGTGKPKKVKFSPGNLLYQASSNKWEFAARQWDFIGDAEGNTTTENRDKNVAYIDLFGWGTWLNGDGIEKPYETQTDAPTTYIWSGNSTIGENWTTLSQDEWIYLLGDYANNETPCRKDAKALRGTKTVNGVLGLVILPDGSEANIANDSWETLEKAGAVFLPAAGSREGTVVYVVGDDGFYWSSSAKDKSLAYRLFFYPDYVSASSAFNRYYGMSVRLVRAAL